VAVATLAEKSFNTSAREEGIAGIYLPSLFGLQGENFLYSPVVPAPPISHASILDPGPSILPGVVVAPPTNEVPPPHPIFVDGNLDAKRDIFYKLVDTNFSLDGVDLEALREELDMCLMHKYNSGSITWRVEFGGKTKIHNGKITKLLQET